MSYSLHVWDAYRHESADGTLWPIRIRTSAVVPLIAASNLKPFFIRAFLGVLPKKLDQAADIATIAIDLKIGWWTVSSVNAETIRDIIGIQYRNNITTAESSRKAPGKRCWTEAFMSGGSRSYDFYFIRIGRSWT